MTERKIVYCNFDDIPTVLIGEGILSYSYYDGAWHRAPGAEVEKFESLDFDVEG